VRTLPGGRHAVTAFDLDSIDGTVATWNSPTRWPTPRRSPCWHASDCPLARISLAPLGRTAKTAEAIAVGDLSRRIIHPRQRTEIGRLTAALNTMPGRIKAAYRAREEGEARARESEDRIRRFVANASHELGTPLTSIMGLSELYLQQDGEASHAQAAPHDDQDPRRSRPDAAARR
jgi:signal transduction histidine kinase